MNKKTLPTDIIRHVIGYSAARNHNMEEIRRVSQLLSQYTVDHHIEWASWEAVTLSGLSYLEGHCRWRISSHLQPSTHWRDGNYAFPGEFGPHFGCACLLYFISRKNNEDRNKLLEALFKWRNHIIIISQDFWAGQGYLVMAELKIKKGALAFPLRYLHNFGFKEVEREQTGVNFTSLLKA